MQATLSLCWFTPGWMYFGHIGDSRIYYLPARERRSSSSARTTPTSAGFSAPARSTNGEARHHPRRTALQKALGGGNQFVDPQVGAVGYEPGDMFLLCTDGLIDGLYDDQLLDLLRRPDAIEAAAPPAQRLVERLPRTRRPRQHDSGCY